MLDKLVGLRVVAPTIINQRAPQEILAPFNLSPVPGIFITLCRDIGERTQIGQYLFVGRCKSKQPAPELGPRWIGGLLMTFDLGQPEAIVSLFVAGLHQ